MKKFYIKTFGCQMNIYDSARMAAALETLGYQQTTKQDEADIILLNTCHIREKAAEKLYSEIGRLAEIKNARRKQGLETLLIVAGCVVQAEKQEMLRRAHGIDIAVGPQSYHHLPELVMRFEREHGRVVRADFPADSKFDFLPPHTASTVSQFLAIQEGCDHFCSYCVVPYTRGCEYSRSMSEIIEEAKRLVNTGAVEIMLLGQNVNCWHGVGEADLPTPDLGDLIRRLGDIKGLKRIRYTTSYPSKITDNLIQAHRDVEQLMPYIHLPIQSGSDRVLKAMNRLYSVAQYEEIIDRFRQARPDIAVSSDFIVGFPGETDEEFEQTLEVVHRVCYDSSYSFKYSPRPGTPASLMKNQIPEDVKTQRLQRLQELLLTQQKQAHEKQVGRVLDVLLTEKGRCKGQLNGYTPYLQNVHVQAPMELFGKIIPVKITRASATSLSAELI